MSADIASRNKKIAELDGLVKDKQKKVQSLMLELAKQRDADSKTTRDLTEQIKQLKKDIDDHQKERKRLHEENLSLNNRLKEAVKKISALGVEVGKLKSTTESDQKRIAKMKSWISKYKPKMKQIKDQLTKAQASLKLVSDKHAEALKYTENLKSQRDMALELADKYKKKLGQVQQTDTKVVTGLRLKIRKMRARVEYLTSLLKRAIEVADALKKLSSEHKVQISGLKKLLKMRPAQSQFRELSKALKASRRTIKALKAKLQQKVDSGDDEGDRKHVEIIIHRGQQPSSSDDDDGSGDDDSRKHVEINIHRRPSSSSSSPSSSDDDGARKHVEINIHGLQEKSVLASDSS